MTKTTKRERKYGKSIDKPRNRSREIKSKKEPELYKVYIDLVTFTKPMSLEDCELFIEKKILECKKMHQTPPKLMIVKH
jgi:hypothetical protein